MSGQANERHIREIVERFMKASNGHDVCHVGAALETFMVYFVSQFGETKLTRCKGIDALASDAKRHIAQGGGE